MPTPSNIQTQPIQEKAIVIPLSFEQKEGYWLSAFTYDKTLFKLNYAKSCDVALGYNRIEIKRLDKENAEAKSERDKARIDFRAIQEQQRIDREAQTRDRLQWNLDMSNLERKHTKQVLKIVGIGVGLSFSTWVLGHFGIL